MPVVGSADVRINADGKSFGPQLQGILNSQNSVVRQSGQQAGQEYTRGFGSSLGSGIRSAMANAQREIGAGLNVRGMIERPMAAEAAAASNSAQRELNRGHSRMERDASSAGQRTGRAFGNSFNRVLDKDLSKAASAAADSFTKLYARGNAMAGALGAAAGGISALVSGLVGIVGAAGSAASSLAAIGPALGALMQGGLAVSVAFKGIGSAISAGMNQATAATNKSTGAGESNKRSLVAAQRAIADARQRVAEVVIQNAERMRAADERVADAVEDVKEAEQELGAAQRQLLATQRALTDARKEAREELQQLAFSAEDAALGEERAALNLEDAYAQLKAVSNLPADNKTRREAELAFKETELNYRQAKDRAQDLAAEQADAAAKGIQGTKAYQSAQKDVAQAQEGVLDAQKGVNQAEEDLADARAERSRVAAQNARDLAKAHQAVKRAQQDAAAAAKAGGAATTQAAKAVDKFAEAMSKLGPEAQEFVRFMISSQDLFSKFRQNVQEPFFEKLNPAFQDFVNNSLGPLSVELGKTSSIMADFAVQLLGMANVDTLGPMMEQNNKFLKIFSDETEDGTSALEDFVTILLNVYKALEPLTTQFGEFITGALDRGADAFTKNGDALESLTEFFNRAGRRMGSFFRIFSSIVGTFGTIFKAAEVPIDNFLTYLETKFEGMNQSAKSNTGAITQHFEGVFDNLKPLLELLGELGMMFLEMGAAPEMGETFEILKGALPDLQRIMDVAQVAGPSLAKLVVQVVKLVAAFADSGSMQAFFDTLTGIAENLNKVFGNETVQKILAVVGPILAVMKALSLFKMAVKQVGLTLLGGFVNAQRMFGLGVKDGKTYASGFQAGLRSSPVVPPVVPPAGRGKALSEGPQAAALGGAAGGAAKEGGKATGIMGKVGGGLKAVGGTALKLLGVFGLIVTAIQILLPVFQSLYKNNEGFRNAVDGLVKALSGLFSTIVSALAPVLQTVSEAFTGLMASIAPVISMLVAELMPIFFRLVYLLVKTLRPVIEELAPVFQDAFSQIIGAVMELVSAVLPIIMQIVGIFTQTLIPAVMELIPVFLLVFTAIMGIVRALLPVLAPIITMIVNLLVQILVPAFQLVAQIVQMAVGIIVEVLKILLPVLIPIITMIVRLLIKILIPSFQVLLVVVRVVFAAIVTSIKIAIAVVTFILTSMINFITKVVLPGIRIIVTVAEWMAKFFVAAIKAAFNFFQSVWNTVLKPAIASVRAAIDKIVTTAQSMNTAFQKAVKAAFKYVQDAYNTYIKPTLDLLQKGFEKIGSWAESARKAVGEKFGGLVDKIKQPVIDAIKWINTNLIGKINSVTKHFGLTIDTIDVPRKAEGGPVEGAGGPTQDNLPHLLSHGEFVMKNRSVKSIGMQNLMYMNKTGKMPPDLLSGGIGGFWSDLGSNALRAWDRLSAPARNWISKGIEKSLGAIWDASIGGWAKNMASSDTYMKKFIGGIVKDLRPKVMEWARGQDDKAAELQKKYEAEKKKKEEAESGGGPGGTKKGNHWPTQTKRESGNYAGHTGIDFPGWHMKTYATQSGRVTYTGSGRGYGKAVFLSAGGKNIIYGHHDVIKVGTGPVNVGKVLGLTGWTGNVRPKSRAGSHLHFQVGGSRSGTRAYLNRLAEGGIVHAKPGGVEALIGEAGRNERVEPLDRQGLSVRDRALIRTIVEQMRGQQGGTGGATVVRVYIGNQEITDIVRTEINDGQSNLAKALSTGRRGP